MSYLRVMLALLFYAGSAIHAFPSGDTTARSIVRAYRTDSVRVHLTEHPDIVAQRVVLPAGSKLHRITVQLAGPPMENAATVVIYGHERGLIAPRLSDERYSQRISKRMHGIEDVVLELPNPYVMDGGQAFVGLLGVDASQRVLLVREPGPLPCTDESGVRHDLVFFDPKSGWNQSGLPMALALDVEYPERPGRGFELDTTLYDAADRPHQAVPYVTCGDLNQDGRPDVASGGVLYVSRADGHVAVDMADGKDHPVLYFMDMDGDGSDELLSLSATGASSLDVWKWSAGKLQRHTRILLLEHTIPLSIATLREGDGAQLAIAGREGNDTVTRIVNLGRTPIMQPIEGSGTSLMAADVDMDGIQELIVRSPFSDDVYKIGHDEAVRYASFTYDDAAPVPTSSSAWVDEEHGRRISLPRARPWNATHEGRVTATNETTFDHTEMFGRDVARDDERPSSQLYADLDNDGVPEILQFGAGACRKLFVFKKTQGQLLDVTWKYGLDDIYGATDALLVDLDRDGKLDIVTDRMGKVEVRYNRLPVPGGTTIALKGAGAGMTVLEPTTHMPLAVISRGRGALVEDGMFVHLAGNAPDSILVQESVGDRHRRVMVPVGMDGIADVRTGKVQQITSEDGAVRTVRAEGSDIVLRGYTPSDHIELAIATLGGQIVARMDVRAASEAHHLVLSDIARSHSLASGTYTFTFQSHQERRTAIVQLRN